MKKQHNMQINIGATMGSSVSKAFKQVETRAEKLARKLGKAVKGKKLSGEVLKYKNTLAKLHAKQVQVGGSSKRLIKGISVVKSKYAAAKREAKAYGISIGQIVQQQDKFSRASMRSARSLDRLQRAEKRGHARHKMMGSVMESMAVGYGAFQFFKIPVEFETSLIDIDKVVEFKTKDGLKKLGQKIKKIATEFPIDIRELAKIGVIGGKMGKGEDEIEDFIRRTAISSVAFDIDPGETAAKMGHIRTLFSKTSEDMVVLGDEINMLDNNIEATAKDIIEVMEQLAGSAQMVNLGSTFTAALSSAGLALAIQPEKITTAFNFLFTRLATATEQSEKFKNALDELGLPAESMFGMLKEDAEGTVFSLMKKLGEAPEQDRARLGTALIDVRHMKVLNKYIQGIGKFEQALALVADKNRLAGSQLLEFNKRVSSAESKLILLKNAGNDLATTLGDTLLGSIGLTADLVSKVTLTISGFAGKFSWLTKIIAGTTVAFTALTFATAIVKYTGSLFVDVWSNAGRVINFFRISTIRANSALLLNRIAVWRTSLATKGLSLSLLKATAAQWRLNIAMKANVIGAIVAGVVALVGLGILLYKKWEPFRKTIDFIVGGIIGLFKAVGKGWTKLFGGNDTITQKIQPVIKPAIYEEKEDFFKSDYPVTFERLPLPQKAVNVTNITGGITVVASPGMDKEELAEEVVRKIHEWTDSTRRGALYDIPDAYSY